VISKYPDGNPLATDLTPNRAKATGGVYTTTYDVTYIAVRPTGLISAVYPVTNVATGTTPINKSAVVSVVCDTFTSEMLICPSLRGSLLRS